MNNIHSQGHETLHHFSCSFAKDKQLYQNGKKKECT